MINHNTPMPTVVTPSVSVFPAKPAAEVSTPTSDSVATKAPGIDASTIKIIPAASEPAAPAVSNVASLRADLSFWSKFGVELLPANPGPIAPEGTLAEHFARHPQHTIAMRVPQNVIVLGAQALEDNARVATACQTIPKGPPFFFKVNGRSHYMYQLEGSPEAALAVELPAGVKLWSAGDMVNLPSGTEFPEAAYHLTSVDALSTITVAHLEATTRPALDPVVPNQLTSFSLRGKASEFERLAVEAKPLFGDVCLSGQATVWYAPSNSGKTLITLKLMLDAIGDAKVHPGNIYYINADDSSAGFARKMRLLDDACVHTLCPGQNGFKATDLGRILSEMASSKTARGVVVIIDTVKKFADLMDKKNISSFADECRKFVMQGGTILCLAHTNKNAGSSGKLVYGGTADLLQDFDAAYTITPINGDLGETVAKFEVNKSRGGGVAEIAYAYAADRNITYEERLASVHMVDTDQLGEFQRVATLANDEELIAAIRAAIQEGTIKKMDLAKVAAQKSGASQRQAMRVLDQYAGNDPQLHRWTYAVKEHGAKVFTLLMPSDPEPVQEAA